jgi:CysZ protein
MTAMTQPPAPWPDPSARAGPGRRTPPPGRLGRALHGAGYLALGLRTYLGTSGIRLLGVIPVLIVGALFWAALALLVVFLDELTVLATPFADTWSDTGRLVVRTLVGMALLGGYVALVVITFATLATLVGQPFYERICDRVERRLGAPPPLTGAGWWRTLPRATLESLGLLALTLLCAVPVFLLGVLPLVGQTVAPVVGAVVSGFFLAIELLAIPLQRRGLTLAERLRWVWGHREVAVGFGVAAFLLFLVPLMNVLAMPAAVVGGTLLVRGLHGQAVQVVQPVQAG